MFQPRVWEDEPPSDPFLYGVADHLFQGFAAPEYAAELALARETYESRRGRVREDEELWELWTQAFLEWFAFEWSWADGAAAPPAARALAVEGDARTAAALRAWLRSQRALVAVTSLKPGRVKVRDLCRGTIFEVVEKRSLHGVDVGDVAEVRLCGFERSIRFGRTFLFHPTGTGAALTAGVDRLRAQSMSPDEILDRCAGLRLRTERYRHIDPVRLYRGAAEDL